MSNDYDDHERGKMLRDTLNLAVDGHSDSENRTCSKEFQQNSTHYNEQ